MSDKFKTFSGIDLKNLEQVLKNNNTYKVVDADLTNRNSMTIVMQYNEGAVCDFKVFDRLNQDNIGREISKHSDFEFFSSNLDKQGNAVVIMQKGAGSGGGVDYATVSNKPQVNGVTLIGNKTTSDLGISYDDVSNRPQINSVTLTGNKTLSDLGLAGDNVTIDLNASEQIEVKDGGLTVAKMNADAVATAISSSPVDTKLSTEKAVKDYVDVFVKDGLIENTDTDSVRNFTITLKDKNDTTVYTKTLSDFILKTRKVAGLDLADDITAQEVQDAIKDLTATLTNKSIDADDNTISNLETDNLKDGVLRKSTDGLQSTTDDTHLISEKLAEDLLKLRLEKVTTMPTASADVLGDIVWYIGNTTTTAPIYTSMHIYKCVVSSGVHSWADLGTSIDTVETSVDTANNLTINLKSNGIIVSSSTVAIVTTSIIETAYFDATTNELVLEFSNGQSLRFNLTALLAGLLPMAIGFTMAAAGWTSDGAGGYIYDLTAAINTILANIPVYNVAEQVFTAVTPVGTENPSALHWCELVLGGGYVLSEDTTVDASKTYYASTQVPATLQWYEKAIDGTYSLSTDTYVNPTKTYFVKEAKTLTGTYQFNASADKTVQSVLDASSATQIALVTTKVAGTWKLYAMAKDGKPNAQITLPVIMTVVNPTVNDMTIVGQAIYKSVASVPSDTMTLTNKTINADDNTITDLEGDNFKASAIGSGLQVASKVLKHINSVAAVSTAALAKVSYDTEGHITGSTALGVNRGIDITSNNLGHTNSVTANTTSGLKFFTYDAQGHINAATNKTLGRGISDSSNAIGHSNTAITAQTTQNVQAIKYDAYGHITAGAARPIVTAWSATTADTNIPSEKLVKTTMDTYLPLAGGTMTGAVFAKVGANNGINAATNADQLNLNGGTSYQNGAYISLYGKSSTAQAGGFNIAANNGTNCVTLNGKTDGTLTWDNKYVITNGGTARLSDQTRSGLESSVNYCSCFCHGSVTFTSAENPAGTSADTGTYTVFGGRGASSSYATIIASYQGNNKTYLSTKVSGTWSAWRRFAFADKAESWTVTFDDGTTATKKVVLDD